MAASGPSAIRVLHVLHGLGLGGVEKTAQLFVQHLDRGRFLPAVFAFSDGERGAMLRAAKIPTFVGPDLLSVLERFRPDIVHLHRAGWPEPKLLRPLQLARRSTGLRAVVETNVFGRHDPSPQAAVIDRHLFVSRFCLERYAAAHGLPKGEAAYDYLYNPVETGIFADVGQKRDFTRPVAGRLSRPDPGKWSALALDFLPLVVAELPTFRYEVVGAIDAAKEFVAARGLEANVAWCEPLTSESELAGFLDGLSLLAHANDAGESFGLAIAEAMAAGLPVVTHPAEGLRDNAQLELVDHGLTGLVANNAEEYARAVLWLLRHPHEARAMGERGRSKAREHYDVRAVVSRLESAYLDLLDGASRTPLRPGDPALSPRPPKSRG